MSASVIGQKVLRCQGFGSSVQKDLMFRVRRPVMLAILPIKFDFQQLHPWWVRESGVETKIVLVRSSMVGGRPRYGHICWCILQHRACSW